MANLFFASKKSKTQVQSERKEHTPWVEKYRPKTVDEVAHQEEVVRTLKKSIDTANLPHLLFYGPPGTGKTSTILAIGKDLYGPELFKQRVLELNASDERGISVVREKVKNFSQVSASGGGGAPGYKLVILDEADAMTADAQTALRRTMETFSKTTRFCLICNYVSRIIEPLASRCAKFRFRPLGPHAMRERIEFICNAEGIRFRTEMFDALSKVAEGDMRKAITYLQSAHRLKKDDIDSEIIIDIAGVVPDDALQRLIKACRSNSFDQLQACVQSIFSAGFPAAQLLSQIHDLVISSSDFTNIQKSKIEMKLGETDRCLQDGADEFLQLFDVASFIMHTLCVSMDID